MVFDYLAQHGVDYTRVDHEAVYTIEDMQRLELDRNGEIAKNLFLRDQKGRTHFLVVLKSDKQADLKKLQEQLGCSRLSFASAERLEKYLGLLKGAVSPLGVLNDKAHEVIVAVDRDLTGMQRIGVHPNDNTATLWISFASLKEIIEDCGNELRILTL